MNASPENTPLKQDCFWKIAGAVFGIASNACRSGKCDGLLYIDLTAGPGVVVDREGTPHEGSPILATRILESFGVPWRALFVDRDETATHDLRARGVVGYGDGRTIIIDGDHHGDDVARALDGWTARFRRPLGLIYVDLPGGGTVPVDAIRRLLRPPFERLDVAIQVAANDAYKRQRKAGLHDRYLSGDVARIGKQFMHAREKNTAHEWTSWRRVFTCSMADLFGKWVPQEWIDAVFAAIVDAPQWEFLCLTKFPQRLAELDWPTNAWVGTTVDRQHRVELAQRHFANVTAGVKWLSCEPLLEPLNFDSLEMFDWVVVGACTKSSGAPEFAPPFDWVADLYEQARASGCRVYLKSNLFGVGEHGAPGMAAIREWPR